MDKKREAMINALATLEDIFGKEKIDVGAINQLREALEEPEQETVGSDPYHLSRILHEMAGSVSMCWEHVDKAGVFQTTQATEFVAKAIAEIRQRMKEAAPQPREWKELSDAEWANIVHRDYSYHGYDSGDIPREVFRLTNDALRAKNGFTE